MGCGSSQPTSSSSYSSSASTCNPSPFPFTVNSTEVLKNNSIPEHPSLPLYYLVVFDNKETHLPRFGIVDVAGKKIDHLEVDEELQKVNDLESLAAIPGRAGEYFAMASNGVLHHVKYDKTRKRVSCFAKKQLEVPSGFTNIESTSCFLKNDRIHITYANRGGRDPKGAKCLPWRYTSEIDPSNLQQSNLTASLSVFQTDKELIREFADFTAFDQECLVYVSAIDGPECKTSSESWVHFPNGHTVYVPNHKVESVYISAPDAEAFDLATDDEDRGAFFFRFVGKDVYATQLSKTTELTLSGIAPITL